MSNDSTTESPRLNAATLTRAHVLLSDADAPTLYTVQPTDGTFTCDGCGRSTSRGFVIRAFDKSGGGYARWDYIIGYACRLDCGQNVINGDGGAS